MVRRGHSEPMSVLKQGEAPRANSPASFPSFFLLTQSMRFYHWVYLTGGRWRWEDFSMEEVLLNGTLDSLMIWGLKVRLKILPFFCIYKVSQRNFHEESHTGTENAIPLPVEVVAEHEMSVPVNIRDTYTHTSYLKHISREGSFLP